MVFIMRLESPEERLVQEITQKHTAQELSNLEYLVYDGVLMSVVNDSFHALMFSLNELAATSPGNERVVIKAAMNLAIHLKNIKMQRALEKRIEKINTVQFETFQNQPDKPEPKEEPPGLLTKTLTLLLIGMMFLGIGLGFYRQIYDKPISARLNKEKKEVDPEDPNICLLNAYKTNLCANNLGISREKMPQVNDQVKAEYLAQKTQAGIAVTTGEIPANKLSPAQANMNFHKIASMVQSSEQGTYDPCAQPVLVASQNQTGRIYVVDGHHRFAACRLNGGVQKVVNIADSIENVLSDLNAFPGVTHEAL